MMVLSDITPLAVIALLTAGFLAGAINAVAGGGTFISFPVFLAVGLPPVVANASNAVAVWPGHALASLAYRHELGQFRTRELLASVFVAGVGGALGAYALASIGNTAFVKLISPLLLAATALFAFGPSINQRLGRQERLSFNLFGLMGIGVFSVYGGFFGAGLGIMLLAGLLLLGVTDPQINNAVKNLLATVVTSIAVLVLAVSGLVAWQHTLIAFAGALLGGVLGASAARKIPISILRFLVIAIGLVLSTYYALKYNI